MSFAMQTKRVGRNDPCPCGSGKKFKRCHGTSVGEIPSAMPPAATHILVFDVVRGLPLMDGNGAILVFTNRESAIHHGRKISRGALRLLGMTDDKWEEMRTRSGAQYVLVDDILSP